MFFIICRWKHISAKFSMTVEKLQELKICGPRSQFSNSLNSIQRVAVGWQRIPMDRFRRKIEFRCGALWDFHLVANWRSTSDLQPHRRSWWRSVHRQASNKDWTERVSIVQGNLLCEKQRCLHEGIWVVRLFSEGELTRWCLLEWHQRKRCLDTDLNRNLQSSGGF